MTPLVSILIPCHNAGAWLAECLASVAAQTWSNLQLVVVDDGSTDDSPRLVGAFLEKHPIGKLVRQPCRGAAAARQKALENASGDYIQYLDADDRLGPEKISRQISRLEGAGRRVASGRWTRFETGAAADRAVEQPNWRDLSPVDYLRVTFDAGAMMHPAAWLLPRAVAAAAGPWNEALSLDDDGEYFTRVVAASDGVLHCPDALSFYRSRLAQSLSQRRDYAAWSSAFAVCQSSTTTLLGLEDSPATRRACARYWLRLAFAAYPDGRDLVDAALARARALDPTAEVAHGGPRFQALSRLVGWRLAKRLQRRFA